MRISHPQKIQCQNQNFSQKRNNMAPLLPVPCEKIIWTGKHRAQVPALFGSNFSDCYLKPLLLGAVFFMEVCRKSFYSLQYRTKSKDFPLFYMHVFIKCSVFVFWVLFWVFFELQARLTLNHSYRMAHILYEVFLMHQPFS